MRRFLSAICACLLVIGCGPVGGAVESPGSIAVKGEAVMLPVAQALYVAEVVYVEAAKTMLMVTDAGLISGEDAARAREINARAFSTLALAKASFDAGDRALKAASVMGLATELLDLAKSALAKGAVR